MQATMDGARAEPKVLFEDINFTVKDHGKPGIEVAFVGKDCDEVVSGSKWFIDGAGEQVREICERRGTALPDRLSKLTGIDRLWQTIDVGHTKWSRPAAEFMIFAAKAKGSDGAEEWWVQTRDDGGIPFGPRATAEVFDAEGAREEANRLAELPSDSPRP